jgi:hypothetical protein
MGGSITTFRRSGPEAQFPVWNGREGGVKGTLFQDRIVGFWRPTP